jgi:hypothetical protein
MNDFNYRLKLLENSSLNKQRRDFVIEHKPPNMSISKDDLRF